MFSKITTEELLCRVLEFLLLKMQQTLIVPEMQSSTINLTQINNKQLSITIIWHILNITKKFNYVTHVKSSSEKTGQYCSPTTEQDPIFLEYTINKFEQFNFQNQSINQS